MSNSTLRCDPRHGNVFYLLQLFGGAVVGPDGDVTKALLFSGKEGITSSDNITMWCPNTGEWILFRLNVKTGAYYAGARRLWPLAPDLSTGLVYGVEDRLCQDVRNIVEKFLGYRFKQRETRPRHAQFEHLRQQVKDRLPTPSLWAKYWASGEAQRVFDTKPVATPKGTRMMRLNTWPSLKRGRDILPSVAWLPPVPRTRADPARQRDGD